MVWPNQQHPNHNITPSQEGFPGGLPQPQPPQESGLKQILKPQGQGIQGLLSPERISGLSQKLGNIQQVLNMIQKTAPIVQEYAPMVKNLPSVIKMMRTLGSNNTDDTEAKDDAIPEIPEPEDTGSIDQVEDIEPDIENEEEVSEPPPAPKIVRTGESTPKLFI